MRLANQTSLSHTTTTSHLLQTTNHSSQTTNNKPLITTTNNKPLIANHKQQTTHHNHKQKITNHNHKQQTTHHKPQTTNHSSQTTNKKSPITTTNNKPLITTTNKKSPITTTNHPHLYAFIAHNLSMITGVLKNKIDNLWNIFWTGGLTNPLDVIEQITYLMFIHDLDESDTKRAKDALLLDVPYTSIFAKSSENFDNTGNAENSNNADKNADNIEDKILVNGKELDPIQLRWSVFRDYEAKQTYDIVSQGVFPFIKRLHGDENSAYSKYMNDAIFKVPTPQKLSQIVDALDDIYEFISRSHEDDTKGDLYEYLLSKISTAGTNGQFRTPRHIIRMIVELLSPSPSDVICDPAFGTGGFLLESAEYLKHHYKDDVFYDDKTRRHFHNMMFTGFDMDRTMLRIGAMNMMIHGIDNPTIEYRDSLSENNPDKDKYSMILTNPPFTGSLDSGIVSPDLSKVVKTKKTELLFLALFIRMLRVGGRCASIVPDGVLFGSSKAHVAVRREIVENHRLEAVISMPSGVFKPYAGVSTAILIFTKTNYGGTDNVWFYDMKADGLSLDDKRAPISENDIPDIIRRFHSLRPEGNKDSSKGDNNKGNSSSNNGNSSNDDSSSNNGNNGDSSNNNCNNNSDSSSDNGNNNGNNSDSSSDNDKYNDKDVRNVGDGGKTEMARDRTEQSFFVPKQEIVDNGYDLTVNKYRKVIYEKVEYPPVKDIIAELETLEDEIQKGLAELKRIV